MLEAVVALVTALVTAVGLWLKSRSDASNNRAMLEQKSRENLVLRKLNKALREKDEEARKRDIKDVESASPDELVRMLRDVTGAGPT